MKKILNGKVFWIIISLLASILLWTYVTGIEGDSYTRTFKIGVEFIGKSVLSERGLSATDLDTNTVTIEVVGPRRTVASLSADSIKAQVNVSNFTQNAKASMQYTVLFPDGTDTSGITVIRKVPESVSFNVSKIVRKAVPVKGSFDGTVDDGCIANPATFEPSIVNISGPEIYVNEIANAWVSFGAGQNVNATYSEQIGYTLVDQDKEPVVFDGVTGDVDLITATLPILKIKDVPLDVELIYKAGANESNTIVTVEPSVICLAGNSGILDGLNKITLATISLDSFENSFSETYPIVIDNSLINVEGVNEAKVTVKIEGLSTKSFNVKNLSFINCTEGYDVEIISKSIDVTLRGEVDELENIKNENIRAVADLKDFDATEGSHMIKATIYIDGFENVGAIGEAKIQLQIKKVS